VIVDEFPDVTTVGDAEIDTVGKETDTTLTVAD
jgi:hypothetical protein